MPYDQVPDSTIPGYTQQPSFLSRLGAAAQPLLGNRDLALALLANSGGPYKQSFGQILGQSGIQAQQMQQQRQQQQMENAFNIAKLQAMRNPQRKPIAVMGADGKPVLVDEQDAVGRTPYAGGNDAKPSALIQAYDRALQTGFKGSLLEFQEQLAKASAQYPYQLGEVGGVPTMVPRVTPNAPLQPQVPGNVPAPIPNKPLSTLDNEAAAKQRLAQAGAAGAKTGESQAGAAFDLPRVETNVNQAVRDIKGLRNDPALRYITGIYSMAPIVPNTPQAAVDARAKQIEGQTFLNAFNQLRGGGAITEVEGERATSALFRLQRSQSTKAYQNALDDLTTILNEGLEKSRKQAGKTSQSAPGVVNWEDLK